ncbi:MAG: hypothetical protein FJW30_15275 [Acidobacteria bacterium]|nr:hypothetical protein [Acidobacteriota bacterium]
MNLHHFVRAEARRRQNAVTLQLPAIESSVLDAYDTFARSNLIFDKELVAAKDELAAGGQPGPPLKQAAELYRKEVWPTQDRENRAWIERVEPLVLKHSAQALRLLEKAYRVKWPTGEMLVDVCPDTGPVLAYTTGKPKGTAGHIVIDPKRSAELDVAFEIMFHEASHIVDSHIIAAVDLAAARAKRKAPEDLWHALIFDTAGHLASVLRPNPEFVPYARRFNVFSRYRAAVEEHWKPWLTGRRSQRAALDALVRAVTPAEQ